ncbi:MAG: triose-phosphate isomerase [Candidatus ainarchaeum sp.]|nr:triose-phosphate isomerase [Candidatus ainarchaeum sp.]
MNQLKLPVLFINFKVYEEASGRNALALAKKAEQVSKKAKAGIVLVVQATDMRMLSEKTSLPLFAQHVDAIGYGRHSGWISPASVKQAGAIGTILNHAEHKISNEALEKTIALAKKQGLLVMACAEDLERARQIASFASKPDFIAIEPPELISREDVSVSTARPELISDSVEAIKRIAPEIIVITGAGIHSPSDVSKAVELGTSGVFVANKIVKSQDQKKAIEELASGLKTNKRK